MPPAVMKVLHEAVDSYPADLKKEILDAVGDLSYFDIFGQEVLVAPFIQSATYKNTTILVGDATQAEDKWQGKSFMILKLGDKVEKACKENGWHVPKIGDWYFGMPGEHDHLSVHGPGAKKRKIKDANGNEHDARKFSGWPCRLVLVSDIRGKTTRPQDIM